METIIRYQPYAWNGERYYPIRTPVFKTKEEAIENAERIINDRSNESVMSSIRRHFKEKPIIVKSVEFTKRGNRK